MVAQIDTVTATVRANEVEVRQMPISHSTHDVYLREKTNLALQWALHLPEKSAPPIFFSTVRHKLCDLFFAALNKAAAAALFRFQISVWCKKPPFCPRRLEPLSIRCEETTRWLQSLTYKLGIS